MDQNEEGKPAPSQPTPDEEPSAGADEPQAEAAEPAPEEVSPVAPADLQPGAETARALAEIAALTEQTDAAAGEPTRPARSRGIAAALSFVWPGLGQLYRGHRRLALAFALPPLLAVLLLLYGLRRGILVLAAQLATDRTAAAIAVLVIALLGLWRLASVVQAYGREPGSSRSGRGLLTDRVIAVGAVAIIVLSHLGVGAALAFVSTTTQEAFTPNNDLADLTTPSPTLAPSESALPSESVAPTPTPSPTAPPSLDKRVTILFTGVDSSAGRSEMLYDSIMVVSYDPTTNSVQMVSVPRDTAGFPMYTGGNVSVATRINAVPTYVRSGWLATGDSPYMTLVKEVGYLVGIRIDYYAVMDFVGFRKMIDTVGGIDIVNSTVIDDPTYNYLNGVTPRGFYLGTGPQHLDGDHALAYVRSRHGSSDWARSSRQQQVVVALLRKVAQPDQLLNLPNLISTMAASITTNFPPEQVADYVAIGQAVPAENINQVVLKPPYSVFAYNNLSSASTTCLNMPLVAGLSIQLFGRDSTWYRKSVPNSDCGTRPTPAPATSTPAPTVEPTIEPTVEPTIAPAEPT